MTTISNDFINKIKKLDNYLILGEEDEYVLVGSRQIIKEHLKIKRTFTTVAFNKDKNFWLFFILTTNKEIPKLEEFREKGVPILILDNKLIALRKEKLRNYLNTALNTAIKIGELE